MTTSKAAGNFMKNNMLFWLLPTVLLAVKLIFDLIPYKPLFFTVTAVVLSVAAAIVRKNKADRNISVVSGNYIR